MNIFKKKNKNVLTRIFRKKSRLEKFYLKNEEFIKYSFVSTVCTGILFLLANFLSYTISFTVLFIWDRKVFKSKPVRRRDKLAQLTSFIIVRVIGFPLDSLVLSVLINKFHIVNMAAKVLGSLIMFMYHYVTNKLFVFQKNKLV